MPDRKSVRQTITGGSEIKIDPAIATLLPEWYAKNARALPWRRDCEPYRVWVSEIMLQQTRAEVVRDYYLRFLKAVPTIGTLAALDEGKLFKLWEGLGYYSRARNMQKAAKLIVSDYRGKFPETHKELLGLPGIGPYTAGAIASICFGQPCPAVDGNVLRIVSRIAGIAEPVDSPEVKNRITSALSKLYPKEHCGDFTQSLMELGATVCLPNGVPKCAVCPARDICLAHRQDAVTLFPAKQEKKGRRTEKRTVFLLSHDGRIALRRRDNTGLLAGLWELPNIEGEIDAQSALNLAAQWEAAPLSVIKSLARTHVFTHIKWEMTCFCIECAAEASRFDWADHAALEETYALPSAFRIFIE